MPLTIEKFRAELETVEDRIAELHHVERTEGAARAFPALADAQHRRMTLRGHIEQLEKVAADAEHAQLVAQGVAVLQAAYDADPVVHPAAEQILAHLASSPDTRAMVPPVTPP